MGRDDKIDIKINSQGILWENCQPLTKINILAYIINAK